MFSPRAHTVAGQITSSTRGAHRTPLLVLWNEPSAAAPRFVWSSGGVGVAWLFGGRGACGFGSRRRRGGRSRRLCRCRGGGGGGGRCRRRRWLCGDGDRCGCGARRRRLVCGGRSVSRRSGSMLGVRVNHTLTRDTRVIERSRWGWCRAHLGGSHQRWSVRLRRGRPNGPMAADRDRSGRCRRWCEEGERMCWDTALTGEVAGRHQHHDRAQQRREQHPGGASARRARTLHPAPDAAAYKGARCRIRRRDRLGGCPAGARGCGAQVARFACS
jgi:hypothetical protein